jgi:hypothetical protein
MAGGRRVEKNGCEPRELHEGYVGPNLRTYLPATRKISPISSFRIEQSLTYPSVAFGVPPVTNPSRSQFRTTKLLNVVAESSLLHRTN